MRVSCLQLNIEWEKPRDNFSRVENLIKEAVNQETDVVCLPELFSAGVTLNPKKLAEDTNGITCKFLSEQAKTNKIYVVGSFIEKTGSDLPKNTLVVFNPQGSLIAKYSKNNLFRYNEEHVAYSPGDERVVFKLEEFNAAPAICYDLRFPELFREDLKKGANLFIIPANWPNPRREHWRILLKARAIENMAYVIGINRVGSTPDSSFFGSSMIISPKGEVIKELDDREGVITANVDVNEVLNWRKSFGGLKEGN